MFESHVFIVSTRVCTRMHAIYTEVNLAEIRKNGEITQTKIFGIRYPNLAVIQELDPGV